MPHVSPSARIDAPSTAPAAPTAVRGFAALGVPPSLVSVMDAQGISIPFPIQIATLPDSFAGRDVLGRGRTGSGKTLAFSLPLVARLTGSGTRRVPGRPRSLVLVPTRELASQVRAVLEPLATAAGLRTAVIFGGVGQNPQVTALRKGVDVLIACPGRLEDLIGQGHCDLGAIEVTVLDEADHMADMGFLPAVRRLLDRTPRDGQRLLFSATLDNGVDVLVRRYLDAPVTHSVDGQAAPPPSMTHHLLEVASTDKAAVVTELASGPGRSLLFTRTKHAARKLARKLTAAGVPAVDLHGNLAQNARERNLASFTAGHVRVLVATDIAARGMHVDEIELVVHVDPPTEHKAYLHRSGRTARAGADGVVVTVATPEQRRDVADLMRKARIDPVHTVVRPGAAEISALAGGSTPRRHSPTARSVQAPQRPRPGHATSPHAAGAGGSASPGSRGRRRRSRRRGARTHAA